jgi:CheY-like chemotaxis protein
VYNQILVVDDDPEIRTAMREVLVEEGYAVATAENGRAALDYLCRSEAPRMILLDLMMPTMDGWEFLSERERHPALRRIPVAVITASELPAHPVALAPDHCLAKPVDLKSVLRLIERHCGRP